MRKFIDGTKSFSSIPSFNTLKDGVYEGYRYQDVFELKDGTKYSVPGAKVKITESIAHKDEPKRYIKRGKFLMESKNFSTNYDIEDDPAITGVIKRFSFGNPGEFDGKISEDKITIKRDPSIMSGNDGVTTATKPNPTVVLDWDRNGSFRMELEPWLTSPVISATDDGIYVGSLLGSKIITESKSEINLAITMNSLKDQQLPVIVLVKGKKAYIFKKSQMLENSGSRLFSDKGDNSKKITTPEEFREYAHTVMKNAHKDNYSEEKTNKVVDDLLKNHKGADFGELIGRLTSGLGNKSYSDPPQQGQQPQQQGQPQQPQQAPQGQAPQQGQQPAQGDPSQGGQPQQGDPNAAQQGQKPMDNQGNESNIPQSPDDIDYSFDYQLAQPSDTGSIIGTMVISSSFAHLFHLCTTDYAVHMAMEQYYKEMPKAVDALAEYYLSSTTKAKMTICVVPQSMNPVDYFNSLNQFLSAFINDSTNDETIRDYVKDIQKIVSKTYYKLTRLTLGRKSFSFSSTDRQKVFGLTTKLSARDKAKEKDQRLTAIEATKEYIRQHRKSPYRDLGRIDDNSVTTFINDKADNGGLGIIMKELMKSILQTGLNKAQKKAIDATKA